MKTKPILLLIAFGFLFGFHLDAQEHTFGFLVGAGVSNPRIPDFPDIPTTDGTYSSLFCYSVNMSLGLKWEKHFGLTIEPGYIQKGGIQRNDVEDKTDDFSYQLHYAQIPILADWHLSDKFYLSLGPEFGALLNAKAKNGSNSYDYSIYYDQKFEISALIGINIVLFDGFEIGLRYGHGLTYTADFTVTDINGNSLGDAKEYNRYSLLFVRYKF